MVEEERKSSHVPKGEWIQSVENFILQSTNEQVGKACLYRMSQLFTFRVRFRFLTCVKERPENLQLDVS